MQHAGILRTWHDDKGFGFIAPSQGGRELFVHISAFPHDGSRPTAGEALSYQVEAGNGGKSQAVRVVRQAVGIQKLPPTRAIRPGAPSQGLAGKAIAMVLLMALGAYGVKQYKGYSHRAELERMPPVAAPAPSQPMPLVGKEAAASAFRCDGRTHCSQVTSCQEATWFINHCPGAAMDGNHDGVPCEQQWCTPGTR
ncbi:MAG: cold shock domain-containing protein [Massilia sp.]|nr:cold shock domain-containing protein [Aquabacterium sp.]